MRDSGSISCEQPGGPGTPANITISGADWSLYTAPTHAYRPDNTAIPDGTAYAVSAWVTIEIPVAAIRDLGTTTSGVSTLKQHNVYTDFQATGLDGTQQAPDIDDRNNYINTTPSISRPGSFNKTFVGLPGEPNNTPRATFVPTDASLYEGPPGATTQRSGNIPVGGGQTVISMLTLVGPTLANSTPGTALVCDAWDNTKLQLHAGDYPANTQTQAQRLPSNGAAVWLSGYRFTDAPTYTVQYSGDATAPGTGEGSTCSTGTWYDDPAAVPGNDHELAAQGIYSAVHHVRIHTTMEQPLPSASSYTYHFFSVALRAVPGQAEGTILPNWATNVFNWGNELSLEDMLKLPNTGSTYNPDAHTGAQGDRLVFTPAYVRVSKQVSVEGSDYTALKGATAGDSVTWRIRPVLSSAATATGVLAQPVFIEECLPPGVIFESASVSPILAQPAPAPADAELKCDAGTYLRFNIGEYAPNSAIPDLLINTHVSAVALPGTYTNTVSAQTDPTDPTPLAARTGTAQIQVTQIAGVKLDKQPLTPVVQVNPEGNGTLEANVWQFDFVNMDAPESISNPDVIDVLPVKPGINGSAFDGTMTFDKVDVTVGAAETTVLYTSAATVSSNPNDATNSATGIAWCDAPAGGNLVIGAGDCPAVASDVTALRLQWAGDFVSGDAIQAKISMFGEGNTAGDSYTNVIEGRADGLTFNVGPVPATEIVVSSSLGDYVWFDANENGLQDDDEVPLPNFPVTLTGTDDLGNAVTKTMNTDADGYYLFGGLRAGTYTVSFADGLQPGWSFTIQGDGSNPTKDSDGDPATGITGEVALPQGTANLDVDQGVFIPRGMIGDYVWEEVNRDGIQGDDETPIEGFKVTLSGTDLFGNPVTAETTTNADGYYEFTELLPGTYTVTFDPASIPTGMEFTQQGAGDDPALDSNGDPTTGVAAEITLAAGE